MKHVLIMREEHYSDLRTHLYPGDGCESAALLFCHCGSSENGLQRLLVHEIFPIENRAATVRTPTEISWDWRSILTPDRIRKIDFEGFSLVTIHSHPNGCPSFSSIDDKNDSKLFPAVHGWSDEERAHGSAVMMPDGSILGRIVGPRGDFSFMDYVCIVGDRLKFWHRSQSNSKVPEFARRIEQAFGKGTFDLLRRLKVGVVGCSGTGSVVVELLARNCVNELVLVDDDVVEEKNLNRILNASMSDAEKGAYKVDVLKNAIDEMGFRTQVHALPVKTADAITALKDCDILFGCVDSAEGRYHLESIATGYLIPYFDVGVRLEADDGGNIGQALAVAIYCRPGRGGILANKVYTRKRVREEGLQRKEPEQHKVMREAGYIVGSDEDTPAVISLNTQAACMSVNDFLARLHGFRLDPDRDFTVQRFSLTNGFYQNEAGADEMDSLFKKHLGLGDKSPLLKNV